MTHDDFYRDQARRRPAHDPGPLQIESDPETIGDVLRALATLLLLIAAGYSLMLVAAAYFPVQP